MESNDTMFQTIVQFYIGKCNDSIIDALTTLDNDIGLVLNEDQPLCDITSDFFENRRDILDELCIYVSDDNLLLHIYYIWTLLETCDQKRIFQTLVGYSV